MSSTAESEDVDSEGLDSATGRNSWLDSCSYWMGSLWLAEKEELSRR